MFEMDGMRTFDLTVWPYLGFKLVSFQWSRASFAKQQRTELSLSKKIMPKSKKENSPFEQLKRKSTKTLSRGHIIKTLVNV